MSFNGYNNKLANVPTITGLSDVVADSVTTDTLIVDGNDVSSIIDQVPINTANIATLQQITTGQSYATIGDTTTFDNNVTLSAGKTMTADNFTGLASNSSQVLVTVNNDATTYYPIFASTGTGQKSLLFDTTTTPLSYTPDTSTLSASNFSGLASTASQVLVTVNNDNVTYYPTFATAVTSQKSLLMDTTTSPLSYVPFTSTLSATNFTAGTNVTTPNILSLTSITPSNSRSILLNGTPIGNAGNTSSVCMGTSAGAVGTMPNNCFCFGTNAGASLTTGIPFSGVQNLFIGANSGSSVTSGRSNVFLGGSAGRKTTTGQYNTQIGAQSQDFPDENFVGSYNTTIGGEARILNDGLSYTTAIGAGVAATTSNTVKIGRSADNTIFDGTVTLNNNLLLTSPATTLTPTELSYLDGATSNIQAQLNAINPANFVTLAGTQTITGVKSISTGLSPSASCMDWLDTVTNNRLSFRLNAGVGAFNSLTEAGDNLILASNTGEDVAGNITIAPWSSTLSGVRINRLKTFIGVGTTVKTAAVECEGSNVTVTGTLTLNNDLILTTPATTLTQTELSYLDGATSNIQGQINAISTANFVTTNTVQNITANKTMYGASLLIDDGTGDNTSLSHFNQILNLKNNNTNTTLSVTGVIAATSLDRIIPTDGSNPTTAQILNTTVTGDNIPNQTNTYFVSAHTYNSLQQITTLSMPSGQIQSAGALVIGMFITSGLGTNFSNGTYVTGLVSGAIYSINQPALNTTLFKVGVNFSLITTNITLSAAVASGTINFNNFGRFQFLTNSAGNQIMPLSIDATETDVNVPLHVNNTATFFQAVNFRQNNITLGNGNVVNLGSGAGSNLTNLVCGLTNARTIVFGTGGNTVLGGDAGNNLSTVAANNTLVGYSAGRGITSTGSSNVCIGKDSGRGISTGVQNTFVGTLSGNQTSGTGNNNVAVGFGAGDSMITTATQNTLIGTVAGDAITTGGANTIVGFGAGSGLLTGINNTIMGIEAGDNITGNYNICIGSGSSVPNAAGGNQIAIGTGTETMFIQGGFNWKFGGVITNSTNGNLAGVTMGQYYTVTMAAASQTITLPNPAAAENLGRTVTFKRKQNTTAFTLTSTGGAGFLPIASIALSASPHAVGTGVFQVTLVADGLNWAIINQA